MAVALVAANLRVAITSVGAILDQVGAATGLSTAQAGVLTALPVLSFALLGGASPALVRRFGVDRVMGAAVSLLTVALVVRLAGDATWLLTGTLLACAGIAVANVLIPVVVKRRFALRIGFVTGVYTAALAAGSALAAGVTAPIALAGGWRLGLGVWAVPAALAAVTWWTATGALRSADRRRRAGRGPRERPVSRRLWSSPRTWALTLFFGTQSLLAYSVMGWLPAIYRDAGFSETGAGTLLAVSILVGVPISFTVPSLAARNHHQSWWAVGLTAAAIVGLAGLLVAPAEAALLWAILLGVGGGAFPLALAFFSLRAATPADTAWLSAVGQSLGYLLAIVGPLGVGFLHATTGGWTAPLTLLIGAMVVQAGAGFVSGRAGHA
ncbi:CP family cyanate transporter-like MFS transporter [Georgenia soli]|uniref:CP family cyanate transporter-like MFS transporter n=1 Tax=Georgenia soli TaxID=638953 RepID=A0A2A9ENB6_9MICO|nr:MFS transporter [Georgenia soli]PFG39745.1 CP family cyanate transporter-like MFS transporter [Georgenia soli]